MKNKNTIFICQITENALKVVKCLVNDAKREFLGIEVEPIAANTEEQKLTEKIAQVFKKLGYNNNPVIVSLPRNNVTCRYLKIPSHSPQEIENIAALQAANYLPYPADELITGYQCISGDKEGYSYINLVIAHKDVIGRYIELFKGLGIPKLDIALSSYGILNLYNYVNQDDAAPVIALDIDASYVELAIISGKQLLFSRSLKLNWLDADWEYVLVDQIRKSEDAYLKEVSGGRPEKIIILGRNKVSPESLGKLNKQSRLPFEIIAYEDKINLADTLKGDDSFASLIGLGLGEISEPLNLLPRQLKDKAKKALKDRQRWQLALYIIGIIFIFAAATIKNIDNKVNYLRKLKLGLSNISNEAAPLEEIEKRFRLFEDHSQKRASVTELFSELYQAVPAEVSLANFSYNENNEIILAGQAPELNSVFEFVSKLEQSAVFKGFNIKVRYATKRKTQAAEFVSFEIACSKAK